MTLSKQEAIAVQFNNFVNNGNIQGLTSLMTEDHAFVDMDGNRIEGLHICVEAWLRFFTLFPKYRNVFDSIEEHDDLIILPGYSICKDPRLNGPAIWTAKIRGEEVAEWRIYADTVANRKLLEMDNLKTLKSDPSVQQ